MMMLRICATIHLEKFREFQQAMEYLTTHFESASHLQDGGDDAWG
jgi:hypothetical protein